MTDKLLHHCRVCGVETDGHGLEGLHELKAVQSWCPKHCLADFEEHDFFTDDGMRYCKRCGTDQDPEEAEEYFRDLENDWGDDL